MTCGLVPHRVKVQEGLVVLPLRGHSSDGLGVFLLRQVEVREGGDDRGTCVRRGGKNKERTKDGRVSLLLLIKETQHE